MLTGEQLRAARAMLQLEQTEVAELAGVSVETIKRVEKFRGRIKATVETNAKIKEALEARGVEFISHGSPARQGGAGVRLSLDRTQKLKSVMYGVLRGYTIFALEEVDLMKDIGSDYELDAARMIETVKYYMNKSMSEFENEVRSRVKASIGHPI